MLCTAHANHLALAEPPNAPLCDDGHSLPSRARASVLYGVAQDSSRPGRTGDKTYPQLIMRWLRHRRNPRRHGGARTLPRRLARRWHITCQHACRVRIAARRADMINLPMHPAAASQASRTSLTSCVSTARPSAPTRTDHRDLQGDDGCGRVTRAAWGQWGPPRGINRLPGHARARPRRCQFSRASLPTPADHDWGLERGPGPQQDHAR